MRVGVDAVELELQMLVRGIVRSSPLSTRVLERDPNRIRSRDTREIGKTGDQIGFVYIEIKARAAHRLRTVSARRDSSRRRGGA